MEYIYIGKLVNTHGIKGEVRILSDFRYKEYIFKKDFIFYVGRNKDKYIVNSYRHHKNFEMVTFKDYYDINLVENLKGSNVYVNKSDLKISDNKILAIDLIDFSVIIDDKSIGKITSILDTLANEVLVLDNRVMIPYVDSFIKNIDLEKKVVYVNNVKGLVE